MTPTEILMAEHRVIERVLGAMRGALHRLASHESLLPVFFLDTVEFIEGYADDYHHQKEEGVLFTQMEAAGFPREDGPIVVMLSEHEEARAHTRAMKSAAERWYAGDATAQAEVARHAQGYVSLLSDHIYKEDNILYPMADKVLSLEDQQRMTATFQAMEAAATSDGSLPRLLALADTLERKVQVSA